MMASALLGRLRGSHDPHGSQRAGKGTFLGEHAFIHIGDVVMIAFLIPPDIRFRRGPPPARRPTRQGGQGRLPLILVGFGGKAE